MNDFESFIEDLEEVWESDGNAIDYARDLGAYPIGPAQHEAFRATPGDMPAHWWKFPDGSMAMICNDGHAVLDGGIKQ